MIALQNSVLVVSLRSPEVPIRRPQTPEVMQSSEFMITTNEIRTVSHTTVRSLLQFKCQLAERHHKPTTIPVTSEEVTARVVHLIET